MKTRELHDPRRWRRVPAEQGGLEAELGAAVRAVAEPAVPDDLRLAHIRQEIQRRQPAARLASGVRWSALPWAVVVVAMLLGSGVTAVAGWALVLRNRPAPVIAPRIESVAPAPARSRPARRWRVRAGAPALLDLTVDDGAAITVAEGRADLYASESAAPVHLLPGDVWRENAAAPPAAPLGVARPPAAAAAAPIAVSNAIEPAHRARAADFAQPARAARPAPAAVEIAREPPPPETAPPPLAPATEAATVAEALHALRASGDARGALVALARYERDFPAGLLRREASLARAEALLALRRPTEALAALDPLELEIGLADRRATLLRGDLRASAGRCAQAEIDFTHVLAAGDGDESAARALYGRGVCRLGRGDAAGARADFQAYSSRFPSGEQRAEVARALGRLGK